MIDFSFLGEIRCWKCKGRIVDGKDGVIRYHFIVDAPTEDMRWMHDPCYWELQSILLD